MAVWLHPINHATRFQSKMCGTHAVSVLCVCVAYVLRVFFGFVVGTYFECSLSFFVCWKRVQINVSTCEVQLLENETHTHTEIPRIEFFV